MILIVKFYGLILHTGGSKKQKHFCKIGQFTMLGVAFSQVIKFLE